MAKTVQKTLDNKPKTHSGKARSRITVKVLLPTGETRWYCLAKKVAVALFQEKNNCNCHSFKKLKNTYMTVPYSDYNKNSHAKLTVGKVLVVKWFKGNVPKLYTRSQFVTKDGLACLESDYSYLRHDYRLINRWRILKALHYWKKKDILNLKTKKEKSNV